jgi:hypothetical protein
MQAKAHCCDSFTVIAHPIHQPDLEGGTTPVSLCRIDFLSAVKMLDELKALSTNLHDIAVSANVRDLLYQILEPVIQNFSGNLQYNNVDEALHLLSLMAQFLSLGFLSYYQEHVGPIHPFFLDTAQRKILLAGSKTYENRSKWITAELTNLTSIGDMLGRQLLTFRMDLQLSPTDYCLRKFDLLTIAEDFLDISPTKDVRKFDLLANFEDLLDTWGPGSLTFAKSDLSSPCAIQVRNGYIYAPDPEVNAFRWGSSCEHFPSYLRPFDPSSKIRIGSLVQPGKVKKLLDKLKPIPVFKLQRLRGNQQTRN